MNIAEEKPLWDWIKYALKKYIYKPHTHVWKILSQTNEPTSVGSIGFTKTITIVTCECGEIKELD